MSSISKALSRFGFAAKSGAFVKSGAAAVKSGAAAVNPGNASTSVISNFSSCVVNPSSVCLPMARSACADTCFGGSSAKNLFQNYSGSNLVRDAFKKNINPYEVLAAQQDTITTTLSHLNLKKQPTNFAFKPTQPDTVIDVSNRPSEVQNIKLANLPVESNNKSLIYNYLMFLRNDLLLELDKLRQDPDIVGYDHYISEFSKLIIAEFEALLTEYNELNESELKKSLNDLLEILIQLKGSLVIGLNNKGAASEEVPQDSSLKLKIDDMVSNRLDVEISNLTILIDLNLSDDNVSAIFTPIGVNRGLMDLKVFFIALSQLFNPLLSETSNSSEGLGGQHSSSHIMSSHVLASAGQSLLGFNTPKIIIGHTKNASDEAIEPNIKIAQIPYKDFYTMFECLVIKGDDLSAKPFIDLMLEKFQNEITSSSKTLFDESELVNYFYELFIDDEELSKKTENFSEFYSNKYEYFKELLDIRFNLFNDISKMELS